MADLHRLCSTGCGRQALRGSDRCEPCQQVLNRRTTWGSRGSGVVCAPPREAVRTIPSAAMEAPVRTGPSQAELAEARLRGLPYKAPAVTRPPPRQAAPDMREVAMSVAFDTAMNAESPGEAIDDAEAEALAHLERHRPGASAEFGLDPDDRDLTTAAPELTPPPEDPMTTETTTPERRRCAGCPKPLRSNNRSGWCPSCKRTKGKGIPAAEAQAQPKPARKLPPPSGSAVDLSNVDSEALLTEVSRRLSRADARERALREVEQALESARE